MVLARLFVLSLPDNLLLEKFVYRFFGALLTASLTLHYENSHPLFT